MTIYQELIIDGFTADPSTTYMKFEFVYEIMAISGGKFAPHFLDYAYWNSNMRLIDQLNSWPKPAFGVMTSMHVLYAHSKCVSH